MARKSVLTAEWHSVREQLQTGDLVLYAGGKGAFCATIKRITKSQWAHVGLVIRDQPSEQPLLWESVADEDMPDLETGQLRNGVRLIPLEEALTAYSGMVAVRLLDVKRTKKRMADLEAFRQEVRGTPFEKSRMQLLRSNNDRNAKEDLTSVFCSELVAKAYMRMGLLDEELSCNNYAPKDFTSDRVPPLKLAKGATLGPEIVVAV